MCEQEYTDKILLNILRPEEGGVEYSCWGRNLLSGYAQQEGRLNGEASCVYW
jgi:hypothetical protein